MISRSQPAPADAVQLPAVHIIGLGVAEQAQLDAAACERITAAAVIIGSARQLQVVAPVLAAAGQVVPTRLLPKLAELPALLADYAAKTVVVLASGDPLYYGIGRWFIRRYPRQYLHFYPAISSVQAACHQLGLALQDVQVVSLHGRPLHSLRRYLQPRQSLLVLTDHRSQPLALAEECARAGFAQSRLSVCENLGYRQQRIRHFSVDTLLADRAIAFDPLHVTLIRLQGSGGVLPVFPGIADSDFITDAAPGEGMISKREVRLAILSLLQPAAGDSIWDIGAGCGSVSVELAYWQRRAQVYAIEYHPQRLHCLSQNRQHFGVSQNLQIIRGRAPEALASLPRPNKVFIGGSGGQLSTLLSRVWAQLPAGGLLVASAVTAASRECLHHFAEQLTEGEVSTVELAVKRGVLAQGTLRYQSKLPVAVFCFVSP